MKLMPQPPLHGPARITRPTLAKASVSGPIRVESGLLEGWVSWVTSIHFHCYGGVLPRRVIAEFTSSDSLSIQLDVTGMEESRLSLIAAKLGEMPCVTRAYWHYA
jgi:hypothetical protein